MELRTLLFALIQVVLAILTFVLPIFTFPLTATALPGSSVGISSFNLITLAQIARFFGTFVAISPSFSFLNPLYRGAEAALAFASIGVASAIIAGMLSVVTITEPKFYTSPASWLIFSGLCAIGPLGYGFAFTIGNDNPAFEFGMGPAIFVACAMCALGIIFGAIESCLKPKIVTAEVVNGVVAKGAGEETVAVL